MAAVHRPARNGVMTKADIHVESKHIENTGSHDSQMICADKRYDKHLRYLLFFLSQMFDSSEIFLFVPPPTKLNIILITRCQAVHEFHKTLTSIFGVNPIKQYYCKVVIFVLCIFLLTLRSQFYRQNMYT